MPAETSLTGRQLGRFRIEAPVGSGGMGAVYKAFDTTLGRAVAVKVLPPHLIGDESRLRRFVQEAKSASSLNHPNIITIHEIGEDAGRHFIAMELVDGETLRERMERRVDVKKLADVGAQIAEGLAVAHAAGIIHRDLKPENVMLSASGYAKILDFGLAKLRDPEEEKALDGDTAVKHTTANAVVGTPNYMSPEQALGGIVDQRSDIFALGCILYEMAAGQLPFVSSSVVDTLHKIIHDDPRPLRDAAPELQRIIRKCLAKEPEARYQSAKDLAIDLRELRRGTDSDSWSGGLPAAGALKPAAPWTVAIIGIFLALAAIAATVIWRAWRPPPRAESHLQITRLTSVGNVISSAISPDGKYIAYAYSDAGQQSLWLRQIATGSNLQLVPPAGVGMWGHTFSPDGNSIYYSVKGFGSAADLGRVYEISILGGQPRLRVSSGVDSSVTFSPDGKRIAFLRNHYPTPAESALLVANADGSGERVLLSKKAPESLAAGFFAGPSWSPDGRLIAAALRHSTPSWTPVAVDAESGQETPLSSDRWNSIGQLAWAPDARRLLLIGATDQSPGGGGSGPHTQIWSLTYPEGERRPITTELFTYRNVSLSADGTMMTTVAADANSSIWLAPTGAGAARPQRLTNGRYDGFYGVSAAPDGTIVFSTLENGNVDLWSMDSNGQNRRQLTATAEPDINPSWSEDGRTIFFAGVRNGQWTIRRIDRDGGGEKELCRISGPSVVSPSPDGRWVYFAGESDGDSAIWKVPAGGGQPVRVGDYRGISPRLSPDGKLVAYHQFEKNEIIVAPSEGVAPAAHFTSNLTTYLSFVWTADGKALMHNGGQNDRLNIWLQPLNGGDPKPVTSFDEQYVFSFDRTRGGDALIVVRGTLSRDAVLIKGF